jgi:hypothetical protein
MGLMNLASVLYQSLRDAHALTLPPGISTSGKKFEDYTVKQLYEMLVQIDAYRVFPPRYTLRTPTFSGAYHQFDIVVEYLDEPFAIEGKFRERAHIEQLFATQGKLIDYCQIPHGFFVTTAKDVNDEMHLYALAHHLQIICELLPPIEYMLGCVKNDTLISRRLEQLKTRMNDGTKPKTILIEWKNEFMRFQDEGYF